MFKILKNSAKGIGSIKDLIEFLDKLVNCFKISVNY